MKKKKALLPILAGALLVTLGLGACGGGSNNNNNSNGSNGGGASSQPEEVKINITAEGDKKELQVGESVQLHADVDGVEWSTRNTEYVSVSTAGLVTAIAPGSARITARKEGYANGSFTITVVKAPEKAWQYEVRLEEAEHYSPNEIWGMDLSAYGMGFMGPGESPVEDNSGATDDGTSLGWLQQGCKETMTFTSDKAVKVELGVTMAYNAAVQLSSAISVKFNGKEVSMAGIETVAPEDESNYYEFHGISFGMVDLQVGNNVLEIEMIGQGPNMDKVVIWTSETLQIASVPAQTKPKIEVVESELTVEVESKVQIQVKNNLAGVEFKSSDETIATVSTSGEVTGVKAGKATIELTKEGYKKASVSVTVKAKPVAGQIILEAEEGTLGGSARVENDANSSGGARVGYLAADTSLTLKATLEEAGEYTVSMLAYSNNVSDWSTYPNVTADELDLSSCMTFKVNDADVALTGKVLPAGAWGNYVEVNFGDFNLVKGENTFAFAFTAQGPNIDYVKLVNKNGGGQVTPPAVETVAVTFDAGDGTGEMAAVDVEKGSEYTLPACSFTAPAGMIFAGWSIPAANWWEQAQIKQPGDKVTVNAALKLTATWVKESITVTFSAGDGTGTMDPVTVRGGEYTLPECTFTAPGTKVFGGWQIVTTNQWGQQQTQIKQPGEKINLTDDLTLTASWKVNIVKSTQVDLSNAFVMEAEEAVIAGAQTQQGGSPVESNDSSHGGKDVGYMAAGASITFNFNASAAGEVKLILMGRSANADWSNWQNPTYYDHALEETTSIKANDADVDVTGKGFLGTDAKTSVQVDLGNINVKAGANTIVVSALKQAPNIDCIALIADGITLTLQA